MEYSSLYVWLQVLIYTIPVIRYVTQSKVRYTEEHIFFQSKGMVRKFQTYVIHITKFVT